MARPSLEQLGDEAMPHAGRYESYRTDENHPARLLARAAMRRVLSRPERITQAYYTASLATGERAVEDFATRAAKKDAIFGEMLDDADKYRKVSKKYEASPFSQVPEFGSWMDKKAELARLRALKKAAPGSFPAADRDRMAALKLEITDLRYDLDQVVEGGRAHGFGKVKKVAKGKAGYKAYQAEVTRRTTLMADAETLWQERDDLRAKIQGFDAIEQADGTRTGLYAKEEHRMVLRQAVNARAREALIGASSEGDPAAAAAEAGRTQDFGMIEVHTEKLAHARRQKADGNPLTQSEVMAMVHAGYMTPDQARVELRRSGVHDALGSRIEIDAGLFNAPTDATDRADLVAMYRRSRSTNPTEAAANQLSFVDAVRLARMSRAESGLTDAEVATVERWFEYMQENVRDRIVWGGLRTDAERVSQFDSTPDPWRLNQAFGVYRANPGALTNEQRQMLQAVGVMFGGEGRRVNPEARRRHVRLGRRALRRAYGGASVDEAARHAADAHARRHP
ncbi:MAG TPA: hypothetical protein VGS28_03885 [Candidatus Saccharimonadales bacterium]|nr:hypothetical protein [Candidatus Saccharimonadales bacterium]